MMFGNVVGVLKRVLDSHSRCVERLLNHERVLIFNVPFVVVFCHIGLQHDGVACVDLLYLA